MALFYDQSGNAIDIGGTNTAIFQSLLAELRDVRNFNNNPRQGADTIIDEFSDETNLDSGNSTVTYDDINDFYNKDLLLDEAFETATDEIEFLDIDNLGNDVSNPYNDQIAQGFQIPVSRTDIKAVEVFLAKETAPGEITVKIQTDSTGDPSGSQVTNLNGTIAESAVPEINGSHVRATFSSTGSLTLTTQYHIVASLAGDPGSGEIYRPGGDTDNTYSDGSYKYHPSGGSWTAGANLADWSFRILRTATTSNVLQSNPFTFINVPNRIWLVALAELGTGAIVYDLSRDGGTTFSTVPMTDFGTDSGSIKIYVGNIDVSDQPSGSSIVIKETFTGAIQQAKIHGHALLSA